MLRAPAVHANEAPTIRYLGTAVNMGSEPEKRLFEDTGIKVKYISKTTDEVVKTILTQPNSFDIVDSEYFSMPKLVPSGSLLGMDTKRIKEWDNVVTAFTEGKVGAANVCHYLRPVNALLVAVIESHFKNSGFHGST